MSELLVASDLRERRERLRLSQAALAERVGASRQAIVAIEAGKRVPSTVLSLRLSRALGCRVEDIFALADAEELIADMELKGRRGELAYRVRGVHEITGHGFEERRVDVLAPGVWVVWLDLDLFESVKGMTVKKTAIRYPLRVVRLAIDPESYPWGLALDGFASEGPRRISESDHKHKQDDE